MRKQVIFLSMGLCYTFFSIAQPNHHELLKIYDEAYHGLHKKNIRLIESSFAASALQVIKDSLTEKGKKYPESFFLAKNILPSLSRYKYFKTISKGTIANMVYFIHQHKHQAFSGIFIVRYTLENKKWKIFETIKQEDAALASKINRKDYRFLNEMGL